MKKREFSQTSDDAADSMKEHKAAQYETIVQGLQLLKVGGTFEQIATACGLEPAQVSRRLSEMAKMKPPLIYGVGMTRKTTKGRAAGVVQLVDLRPVVEDLEEAVRDYNE